MIPGEAIDVNGIGRGDVSFGSFRHCTLLHLRMTPGSAIRISF
jgi:hypothetical protein